MKKLRAGFTIIELLIFMGLMTILLGIFTSIFLTALDVQISAQATSDVEQEGRYLLTRLTYDIHRAEAVTFPDVGSSGNQLILDLGGTPTTYSLSGEQFQLSAGGVDHALSSSGVSISQLAVTRIGSPSGAQSLLLSFTVTGTGTFSQPAEVRSYQTTVGLR